MSEQGWHVKRSGVITCSERGGGGREGECRAVQIVAQERHGGGCCISCDVVNVSLLGYK